MFTLRSRLYYLRIKENIVFAGHSNPIEIELILHIPFIVRFTCKLTAAEIPSHVII